MKNIKQLFLVLVVSIFAISSISAKKISESEFKIIEDNLLVGLSSDNLGLQVSSAYFLGHIKSDKALIPLMKMLRSSQEVEKRLIAAVSLAKLESSVAIYAIKQRIKYDESKRVQRLCKILYNNYRLEQIKGDVIVEPFNIADLNIEYKGIKLQQFLN